MVFSDRIDRVQNMLQIYTLLLCLQYTCDHLLRYLSYDEKEMVFDGNINARKVFVLLLVN